MRRTTNLGMFFVLTLGVLFSYSRAAWLNLAVGISALLFVMLFQRGGAIKIPVVVAIVLSAAVTLASAVALTGSTALLVERARLQSYDTERFSAQAAGIKPAERYPLGLGPGQFESYASISAHNTYVRVLAEEGVPGLLLVATLIIVTLAWAARSALLGGHTYGIGSAALIGAWCGIAVNGMFVDTLHWRHLWLVAGLIWSGAARVPSAAALARQARR
jgi:O-antigen ligase